MPAYLVELPQSTPVSNLGQGSDKMVIFAADVAGARRAAAGRFDGDGNALWNTLATITEIVTTTLLADSGDGWSGFCRVTGGAAQTVDPIVAEAKGKTRNQAQGIIGRNRFHLDGALNSGGTATYIVDDILTAAGGTFIRAATFRVITVSTGVITAIELVDPGEYSVLPTLTANAVTGGGGTNATIDLSQFASNSYEAIMAQMVTELAAFADLTSSLDLSEGAAGARLFTVATVGDNIGDAAIEFEIRNNGTVETVLLSTIVDEGSAGAVLTVAVPASPLAPPRIVPVKSTS